MDTGCRDIAELTEMGFPVWSRAVSPQGTIKKIPGNVQTPIECAGVAVRPGDVVVADEDGIVVVRREDAETVLDAAQARNANEAEKRQQLGAGVLGLDMYKMREPLEQAGLRYEDWSDDA